MLWWAGVRRIGRPRYTGRGRRGLGPLGKAQRGRGTEASIHLGGAAPVDGGAAGRARSGHHTGLWAARCRSPGLPQVL